MTELRTELPELPERMRRLPVDQRGYPVPWFVAWLDEHGNALPRGQGKPDFRILAPFAIHEAKQTHRCWICGQTMGRFMAFTIGSMCAVNRVSAEPPSHTDCADFAARACPFLTRPHAKRRPVDGGVPQPGIPLMRNPGVALVWVTRSYRDIHLPGGTLFQVGDPEEVRWYCEGRRATRDEVWHSIETGLPELLTRCEGQRDFDTLAEMVAEAEWLLPELEAVAA